VGAYQKTGHRIQTGYRLNFREKKMKKYAGFAIGMVLTFSASAQIESKTDGACLSYDCSQMTDIKTQIKQGGGEYAPAYEALMTKATDALKHVPYSVTEKTLLPASGDKHDYYSFGPYWWPNPKTKSTLPYIRKDGQINPSSKTDDTDSKRMVQFANDVRVLSLAAFYSEDARFAVKANALLNAWFLDKKTRMNPNLNFAQAIPGVVNGRGIGIIDTRVLIDVADSIALLHHSGNLTDNDFKAYQRWYAEYTRWLLNSPNGREEGNWYNNHGAWYDAQVTAFSLFTGDKKQAAQQIETFKYRHLAAQVNAKGELPAELERTRSFHYTNFALAAYARMGRYGEIAGNDLWGFELDGRKMENAFAVVAQQVGKPAAQWQYPELKFTPDEATGPLLAAARAYNSEAFRNSATALVKENPTDINRLMPGTALVN
jgi:hypothetical protein